MAPPRRHLTIPTGLAAHALGLARPACIPADEPPGLSGPAAARRTRALRLLTMLAALLTGVVHAQAVRTLPAGLERASAAIESAAVEAFAGPDRSGKDGPMAPVGFELARVHAIASVPGGLDALRAASGIAGAPIVREDRVLVDVTAVGHGADLLRDLEALGLENGAAFGRVVSGELPIEALPRAAALSNLAAAAPARATLAVGDVDSQADRAMRSDVSRAGFGVDGTGVSVGTLSDSYDCNAAAATSAADDVASGDLPAGVVVLEEFAGCATSGSDEGRAMMQLIHDVAPGADQMFHTAFNGQASFAQGIVDLDVAGADVIVDDVYYFAEPFFQDGIIAQAVDQVVSDGVAYFSSVGNQADASYEADFRPVPKPAGFAGGISGTVHDFDPGVGIDGVQGILIEPGATVTVILQWDDPFAAAGVGNPGAAGDVDLFLTNPTGTAIVAQSVDDNVAGGNAVEIVQVTNSGASPVPAGLVIGFFGGVQPTVLKHVFLGAMSVEEYATNSATGFGHANAAGAQAVAAAYYAETPEFGQSPPLREAFTSLGGVPIYFDVNGTRLATPELRTKPEITAPDGTDTTFFGFDSDGTGFPNFFGTSAAAPHAAAVAALLSDQAPAATPAEIRAALQSTAIDMDAPGFDAWTGHGLIQADLALLSRAGSVGFAAASYTAPEDAGTISLSVERTGGSAGTVSVDYATGDDTATAGSDYTTTTGTLTWTDGDATPKTIDVPILDDNDPEGDETLDVTLDQPTGTTIDQAQTTVTILEDDATTLTVAEGPNSPAAALRSRVGETVTVLQLSLAVSGVDPPATVDAIAAALTVEGEAGAPTDVAAVRVYVDVDGDGAIDAGSDPIAVAVPDASGRVALAPTGLTVSPDGERFLLVELALDADLASFPRGVPLVALTLPFLVGFARVRRRPLVGMALAALVVVAACGGPPARSADVTTEIVAVDASSEVRGVTVTTSGLPIEGSVVTVRE